MRGGRIGRRLASAAIAAAALAGAAAGAALLVFEEARARVAEDATPPAERTRWLADPGDTADAAALLTPWRNAPGLAAAARSSLAAHPAPDTKAPRRLIGLADVVTQRPTDANAWLALAETTLRLGYGQNRAAAAYDMSVATGRRNADLLLARAEYAIRHWETLDEGRRTAALGGLGEVRWRLKAPQFAELKSAISARSVEDRAGIRTALPQRLLADGKLMKAVGL
jgi:hypothetical protein